MLPTPNTLSSFFITSLLYHHSQHPHILFSFLNLSQASLSVANTVPAIILTSVDASVGICFVVEKSH